MWPEWVGQDLVAALAGRGVAMPWSHQTDAAEAAWAGRNVVISTGTASGKSLGYLLPSLSAITSSVGCATDRGDCTLYLSPTKALARDQLASVCGLGLSAVRAAAYDGDCSTDERDWARRHANFVVTNPDMLHRSMLPRHPRWADFLAGLRFVVVDECHHYRGIFGAHVALILRRLRRVAAHYGATPTFVLASATTAEPAETGSRLVGAPVEVVADDGSPRGPLAVAFWQPALQPAAEADQGDTTRRSATAEAADLLADLVADGVRTLAFVRSRRTAETVAAQAQRRLGEVAPELAAQVSPYRGGYLPEDRRAIEQRLRSGELLGVAATNALELGIDIAGLDAVLVAGFPGTRASWWQQVGRAGRSSVGGLGVLVARDDPLDTYLVNHPEVLTDAPVEATVFDPSNPYVVAPHLCAAAEELPLAEGDLEEFGPHAHSVVAELERRGLLRRRSRGWFWTSRDRAADLADIRSSGGPPVRIVEAATGRLVGTVDAASAHSSVHTGAVYLHQGDTYVVEEYDDAEALALVHRRDVDYYTTARELTDITIVDIERDDHWGGATLSFGSVDVSSQVVGFLSRRAVTGDVLSEQPLDLPARHLHTRAVWWSVEPDLLERSGLSAADLPGSAHAAEHASIGLLPLFATCDRWDIGGVSTALHPDTGRLTVFVYDGHQGGAGFAERGYTAAPEWLAATREAIVSCPCREGCPSCVQSPKCGNGNSPLDKRGAVLLLDLLLIGSRPVETRRAG